VWAYKWVSRDLKPDNLDPGLLMWFLRRRIRIENLPRERVVLRFEFRDRRRRRFWLVLDRPDVDLCYVDPGFAVDVQVSADVRALTEVYLAHVSLDAALRAGTVTISGPQEYRKAFRSWLDVTPFARSPSIQALSVPCRST
jgi:hypothetical protein